MKSLKLTLTLIALVGFTTLASAQRGGSSTATTVTSAEKEYVIATKKLMSYFVSGQIPADFPKYDPAMSQEDNEAAARNWAMNNSKLLTEEAKAKFDIQ